MPGTVPNPAIALGKQDIACVNAMGTAAVGMREVPGFDPAQLATSWMGEPHEP